MAKQTRPGVNVTMSYQRLNGTQPTFRARANRVTSGFSVIADESQGRTARAMYPRNRTSPTDFMVTLEISSLAERAALNAFLVGYANYVLDVGNDSTTYATMTVDVPSRNFRREGVIKEGMQFGIHVGEMYWSPTLVFETSREPSDWDATFKATSAQLDLATFKDDAANYYYPSGVQLAGSQAAAVQTAISGAAVSDAASAIGDAFDDFAGFFG